MKHYLRLLTGLTGLAVLCLTQLGATAHAGFSAATLRVDLGVTVAPPAAPVTVTGSFTYGVTCVGVVLPQFVLSFPPPAFTIAANAVTPIANSATVSTGTQNFASNDCTFTQLTRPAAPAGLQWSGSPPNVTITNIVAGDPPPVYAASFANVLVLPTVTGVANPPAGGTVTCTPLTTVGANSTCTAVANPNYVFSAFVSSGCGGPSGTSPYITSSPVLTDCTVTGSFSPLYTVTAVANPPAGGTATCSSPIAAGTFSTCMATANSGYTFAGFSTPNNSCGNASATSPYFTAPLSANCVVNAAFTQNALPVTTTVNIPAGGSVNCAPNPVVVGSTATCTVTTNPGYLLTGLSGCGGATTAPGSYVTAPIAAACTVAATFAIAPSVPVPTLGTWMLILLGLLTVGMGVALSNRRVR